MGGGGGGIVLLGIFGGGVRLGSFNPYPIIGLRSFEAYSVFLHAGLLSDKNFYVP